MALSAGEKLGPYEIVTAIGQGGMGAVYRAHDSRLGRDVAVKVSEQRFGERFEREAKAVAALNHPNICTLHDVGPNYLVMELVEGQTLSERIKEGPLPLEESLGIAHQIANALEAAHEKGIVHRDLKPGNVILKHDGSVKVLDFGLAKVAQRGSASGSDDPELSPTISMAATQAGVILGTAAYMAPEQAKGKPVDKRADIWAFGVVLYEMVTGQKLFAGEDLTETLAAVVLKDPDLHTAPAELRPLLEKCLQKDPRKRLRDISGVDALLELGRKETELAESRLHAQPKDAGEAEASRGLKAWLWPAVAGMTTVLAAIGFWLWLTPAPPEPRALIEFTTAIPEEGIGNNPFAWSPDGSRLAFVSATTGQIFIRDMSDPVPRPVAGTQGAKFLRFSPDGEWIAYEEGPGPFQLKKVPISGGAALTLASGMTTTNPMTWGDDDNILVANGNEIWRVAATGGTPEVIATADPELGEYGLGAPRLLPGGEYLLTTVFTNSVAELRLIAINLSNGERTTLVDPAGSGWFAPTGPEPYLGHLVYGQNGALFAVPFNARTLALGSPVPVLEGVQGIGGLVMFGFSDSGALAYSSGEGGTLGIADATLIWVDRQGAEQDLNMPAATYQGMRVSPDGGRLALARLTTEANLAVNLWVYDLTRETLNRLTSEENLNQSPVWSPDGRQLVFLSGRFATNEGDLMSVAADGSSPSVSLLNRTPPPLPGDISQDGILIGGAATRVMSGVAPPTGNQLWSLRLGSDFASAEGEIEPFLDARFLRGNPRFSPDGKWVAYDSNQAGRSEVYVSPFPGAGSLTQISTTGGTQPVWNPNGRELFYRNGSQLLAVDVEAGETFRAGTPKVLFEKESPLYEFDAARNRFLLMKRVAGGGSATADGNGTTADVHVIVNWFDRLREQAPLDGVE